MRESRLYSILRPFISFLFKLIYRPKIIGKDNIPKSGRVILAGNHTSILDAPFLISTTKRNIHFLAKKELWEGAFKIFFSNMGLICVDRSKKDGKSLVLAKKYLDDDKVIGIFPEGTISKGNLLDFKKGAALLSKETNSLIVPFVIRGKYKVFSKDLTIKFLKPIKCIGDPIKETDKLKDIINIEREKI